MTYQLPVMCYCGDGTPHLYSDHKDVEDGVEVVDMEEFLGDSGSTTVTCACGHTEVIEAEKVYHLIPTGRSRYVIHPDSWGGELEDEYVYICEDCWEKLPDE